MFEEPAAWGAVVSFVAMVVSASFAFWAGKSAKRSLENQDKLVSMARFRLEQEQCVEPALGPAADLLAQAERQARPVAGLGS